MIQSTLIKKLEPEYVVDKYWDKKSYNSNGLLHSFEDNPAVICGDGSTVWYKNGKLHRDNGLPAIIWWDGEKEWHVDGQFVRRGYV